MKTTLFAAAAVLAIGAAPAEAARYTITATRSGVQLCQMREAIDPRHALQDCLDDTFFVPLWAVVITATQVCKSTHRVTQVSPVLLVKWGYDTRFSAVVTPNCP
jgi:hypothetical protein